MTDEQLRRWEQVKEQIIALEQLEPGWDGADAPSVPLRMVRATISWTEHLKLQDVDPPHDVYPLSDGNVILEWQLPNDVIRRIEIKEDCVAREMVTYPSSAAKFKILTWHSSSYIMGYLVKAGRLPGNAECLEESEDGHFSLAA